MFRRVEQLLIVDGHSAIFGMEDLRELHQGPKRHIARLELVKRLREIGDRGEWKVVVVFDGRQTERGYEGGAEEGAVLIVEGGLEVGAVGPEVFQGGVDGEEIVGFAGGDRGGPTVVFLAETEAERGVAAGEGAEGAVQSLRVWAGAEGEQEGLVPVVGVG